MIVSPCFNLNVVVPLIATFSFFPLLSEPPVIVAGREYSSPSFPVNVTVKSKYLDLGHVKQDPPGFQTG